MEFIKPGININFIGRRNIAFALSSLMIIATFFLLVLKGGPNLGVDFSGWSKGQLISFGYYLDLIIPFLIIFLVSAPLLAKIALKFRPQEYFALAVFALSMLATISGKSSIRNLIAGAVGVLIGTVVYPGGIDVGEWANVTLESLLLGWLYLY